MYRYMLVLVLGAMLLGVASPGEVIQGTDGPLDADEGTESKKVAPEAGFQVGLSLFVSDLLPDFDGAIGFVTVYTLALLKLATIFAFPFALGPLYKRFHGNRRNAVRFASFFVLGWLVLMALYVVFVREPLAVWASDHVVRFFYVDSPVLDEFPYLAALEDWRADWRWLIPQWKDFALMLICLALLILPGYFDGPRWIERLIACISILLVVSILPTAMGLVILDYDLFLAGVFFDLLWCDLVPFFWLHTSLASGVFFTLAGMFYAYTCVFCRLVAPVAAKSQRASPTSAG